MMAKTASQKMIKVFKKAHYAEMKQSKNKQSVPKWHNAKMEQIDT
jgi:arabinogalactan endo-1,4-beta-galactosidase